MCRDRLFAAREGTGPLHLNDLADRDDLLARLGKHRTGKSCLYVKRLAGRGRLKCSKRWCGLARFHERDISRRGLIPDFANRQCLLSSLFEPKRSSGAAERACILLRLWHATRVAGEGILIDSLPRREREIFELLCSAGEATAADIRGAMRDPPSYSAVRTLLSRLEGRGLVNHSTVDQAYVYRSVPQPAKVRESALRQMVKTFFDGSAASAATALLGLTRTLSPEEVASFSGRFRMQRARMQKARMQKARMQGISRMNADSLSK